MERKECCLISDFDGVIVNSLPLIDEFVKVIDYKASDEYLRKLVERSNECHLEKQRLEEEQRFYCAEMDDIVYEIEDLQKKRKEHYDHKNIVLEEVRPDVRDLIKYDTIYRIENAYEGVIETLTKIWESKVYEKFYVCSNINVGNEIKYKREFINLYLPMAKLVTVRFFLDPYFNPVTGAKIENREPNDKLKVLTQRCGNIDIPKSIVVDDTKGVITNGLALGFRCYHRKVEDDVRDIFIASTNDTIDIVHGGKIKKLSR